MYIKGASPRERINNALQLSDRPTNARLAVYMYIQYIRDSVGALKYVSLWQEKYYWGQNLTIRHGDGAGSAGRPVPYPSCSMSNNH